MSKDFADLNELPVDSIEVVPANGIEQLETGYGMTETAGSCSGRHDGEALPCGSCRGV